ncbi:MAG TPA: hypothetical protein VHQ45_06435 [Gemmatimonadaceae bacterium]|nr:hypothetical protein [Gemmatimonadaceae bacterium]
MNPIEPAPRPALPSPTPSHWKGADADAISVVSLLNGILRHRGLVAALALLAFVTVIGIGLVRARTYSSSAAFTPQARRTSSNLSGLAAQFGLSLPTTDGAQSPQFYMDLLESRPLLGRTVESHFEYQTDTGAVSGTLVDIYDPDEKTPGLRREAAMRKLAKDIAASIAPKTGVVTITVRAEHPVLAHQIADRLLALTNEFNLETRQSQAAAERQFTERRLAEVRTDLRAAENRQEDFLRRNREYGGSPTLRFEQERLAREVSLQQELYTTIAQSYEQAKIEEVRDTPVITVVAPPEVPVKPDPRGLLKKGILALVGGAMLGILIAIGRTLSRKSREMDSVELEELSELRRAAMDDITHPWRPLGRMLRARGHRS